MPIRTLTAAILGLALAATPPARSGGPTPAEAGPSPPAIDLATLPALEGAIRFSRGSFFGYIPPRRGDTLHLAFDTPAAPPGKDLGFLRFGAGGVKDSYIPLPGPFRFDSASWAPGKAGDRQIRLVSVSREKVPPNATRELWKVTFDIDVEPGDDERPRARFAIVVQNGEVISVAYGEGRFLGKLPDLAPAGDALPRGAWE